MPWKHEHRQGALAHGSHAGCGGGARGGGGEGGFPSRRIASRTIQTAHARCRRMVKNKYQVAYFSFDLCGLDLHSLLLCLPECDLGLSLQATCWQLPHKALMIPILGRIRIGLLRSRPPILQAVLAVLGRLSARLTRASLQLQAARRVRAFQPQEASRPVRAAQALGVPVMAAVQVPLRTLSKRLR